MGNSGILRPIHSVRFDSVVIREYPIVIGDSPSTSNGVPISLGWEYKPVATVCIDEFESTRKEELRNTCQLWLPSNVREEMLGDAGFSELELREAVQKLLIDKRERRASITNYRRQRSRQRSRQRKFLDAREGMKTVFKRRKS